MFWCFDELFSKRLQKVDQFVTKHEKSSIWLKLCNFSNKLPCLCISINFSGKSCRKCLISWKSTRIHRFGQIFGTFRTNYHFFAFRSTFREKVAKSASFRDKAREIIDLANTMQLFNQTTMFLHFDELLRKRLGKVVHFVKKHEKSWIWSRLATFRTNYHAFTFRWTFRQTVAETASFREKARKLIDLAKTMQLFLTNYHVLVFRWTFQQKVAESGSIREKERKIIDLAKSLELSEQTTIPLHFDQLFRKKLQKVPHFVKKDEKSSICPKLCNFSNKLPCLCISMNLSEKSCRKCLISWRKTRNHRFGQNWQLFEQTTMFWPFHELFRKKLQKVPHFVRKHEK